MSRHKQLGQPATIGDLKKLIDKYPDETPFGFYQQPIQNLIETNIDGEVFVSFHELEQ